MSGRAVNWVWDNHSTKGSNLLVLLAIAKMSHRGSCPFKTFASHESIAKLTGLTKRYVIDCVDKLIADRQLEITREGAGSRPNLYDILPDVWVNRGSALSVNRGSLPQQRRASENDGCAVQETYESAPEIPNVLPILYPKPKRKRA